MRTVRQQAARLASVWAPLALIYALVLVIYAEWPLEGALLIAAFSTATASLLGVPLWYLTGRLPWPSDSAPRFIFGHLAMAAGFSLLWLALDLGVGSIVLPAWIMRLKHSAMGWETLVGLLLYGVMTGAIYAVRAGERLAERQRRAADAEARAARAELAVLRAQLNPHFLFNALHSVSALIRRDPESADDALERLGALIRYALSHAQAGEVTLEEDVGFARDFAEIERLRLGDRLRLAIDIEPAALDARLPALTVQPLVDNAIRHGLSPLTGGGTIWITARVAEPWLHLAVADNGAGLRGNATTPGLGLGSLEQRMQLACPGAAVTTETPTGGGFLVQLRLPLR